MRASRLLAVGLLVLAGCGGGSAADGDSDPAEMLPADSVVYLDAVIRPEGDQLEQVNALAGRVLQTDDPAAKVHELIDKAIAESGEESTTYEEDIAPWLGENVGLAVTNIGADEPGFIAAVAVKDTGKAGSFLAEQAKSERKRTYDDVQYYIDGDDTVAGVVDDFIVFADTEADFKRAVDLSEDDSLAEVERFDDALDDLPEERLGTMYVDTKAIPDALAKDPDVGPQGAAAVRNLLGDSAPLTAYALADEDSVSIESRFSAASSTLASLGALYGFDGTPLVGEAPAGTFAALGAAKLGTTVKELITVVAGSFGGAAVAGQLESQLGLGLDRDVYSWLGDTVFFVRGETLDSLDGGLLIEATDEAAASAALPRIVAAIERSGGPPITKTSVPGADQAWAAVVPDAPAPVVLARAGDRVVLALGPELAALTLRGDSTIADSGLYDRAKAALDGLTPSVLVDGASAAKLIEEGAAGDEDFAQAKPYLAMLDLLTSGSKREGDTLRSRFTLKLK